MIAAEVNLVSRLWAEPAQNGRDHRPKGGILRTGLHSPHFDSMRLCAVIGKSSVTLLRKCHKSFVGRLPIY